MENGLLWTEWQKGLWKRQLIYWDTNGEKKPAMQQHGAESLAEEAKSTKIWSLIQFGILEEGVKNRLAGMCSAKDGTRYIWRWLANLFTLHYQLLENRAHILLEFASLILSLIYGTQSINMCWMTKLNKPFPKVIYKTLGNFLYTICLLPATYFNMDEYVLSFVDPEKEDTY